MGTPMFSATILEALVKEHKIVGVVTKEDKKRSRGNGLDFSEVKKKALEMGIEPILQPSKVRDELFLNELKNLSPDIIVTAAYGKIVPKALLDIPRYGCINVHASLLPKYRGASPIQAAILNGDSVTGITIIQMDEGMDTGDMLVKKELSILPNETSSELFDRLAVVGIAALREAILRIENGTVVRIKQDENEATYTHMIKKEEGHISFADTAINIVNRIRAIDSYCFYNEEKIKLIRARVYNGDAIDGDFDKGQIVLADKRGLVVKCGDGFVAIEILQLSGKKPFDYKAYINGYHPIIGGICG